MSESPHALLRRQPAEPDSLQIRFDMAPVGRPPHPRPTTGPTRWTDRPIPAPLRRRRQLIEERVRRGVARLARVPDDPDQRRVQDETVQVQVTRRLVQAPGAPAPSATSPPRTATTTGCPGPASANTPTQEDHAPQRRQAGLRTRPDNQALHRLSVGQRPRVPPGPPLPAPGPRRSPPRPPASRTRRAFRTMAPAPASASHSAATNPN